MSKKNWIFVKRGLSEDPKHRQAMGDAIWLYMHMCDAADWEKGIVYDWRDKDIGIDMSLSTATVRAWRDRLSKLGYITCTQRQHCLEVTIHNWTNPRDYSGKKMNIRQGDMAVSPSKEDEVEGVPQGVPQGDTQGLRESTVEPDPFIESSSLSSSSSLSTRAHVSIPGIEASILQGRSTTQEDIGASNPDDKWKARIPEQYQELLLFYSDMTGQRPTAGQISGWIRDAMDWQEARILTVDLKKAYEKANPPDGSRGFAVVRPGSLTATAGAMAGERHLKHKANTPPPVLKGWLEITDEGKRIMHDEEVKR
jgi:hypothetical protein